MIQQFSDWSKVNEVEELTEKRPKKKFIDQIAQTYAKYPKIPPSRDINDYPNSTKSQENLKIINDAIEQENILSSYASPSNTPNSKDSATTDSWKSAWASYKPVEKNLVFKSPVKDTLKLDEFIKQRPSATFKDILLAVIKDWYKWPEGSQARTVLEKYFSNDDDLDNVTLKKVINSDPSILLLQGGLAGLACFAGAPVIATLALDFCIGYAVSSSYSYIAYGDIEAIEDDPILNPIAPFLPKIKGADPFGTGSEYDPFQTDYQSVFNIMMLLIYDTWNLCMGQEANIDWKRPVWDESKNTNPIRSFNSGNKSNYLDIYMQTYCKSSDIKGSFINFIKELNNACSNDQNNSEIFYDCPFFYTGGKILLINSDDNGKTSRLTPNEFKDWIKTNYVNNEIQATSIPLAFYYSARKSRLFARSFTRKSNFFSNVSKKLNAQIKMYGPSGVTVEKLINSKGQLFTLPDLENKVITKIVKNKDYKFRIQYENISNGGNKIVFEMVKKKAKSKKPSVSIDSIKEDIISSSPSEFSGMRDI